MCLLRWLDRLPSKKSLTPFLLIPPNSQHLLFQFFRFMTTNIYGPATLAGQGSCLLYLKNPAKSPKQPAFYLKSSIIDLMNGPIKNNNKRMMIPNRIHHMTLIP